MDADHLEDVTHLLGHGSAWRAACGCKPPRRRVMSGSKEEPMRSGFARVTQSVMLAGLTLALVVSGAAPLLGNDGVEAAKKGRRAKASGDVHAEAIQTFSNGGSITIADGATTQSPITVSGLETPIADV